MLTTTTQLNTNTLNNLCWGWMYDISLLCLIKASVTLHCEIIVSHEFKIDFDKKSHTHLNNHSTLLLEKEYYNCGRSCDNCGWPDCDNCGKNLVATIVGFSDKLWFLVEVVTIVVDCNIWKHCDNCDSIKSIRVYDIEKPLHSPLTHTHTHTHPKSPVKFINTKRGHIEF